MDIIKAKDLDRVMSTDKRYIAAANSPDFYWHFCPKLFQQLDEEGYGPFLCSEQQIMRWEKQAAQDYERDEMPFHKLLRNPPQQEDDD